MVNISERSVQPRSWLEALTGAVPIIAYGAVSFGFALNQNSVLTDPGPFGWAHIVWVTFIANLVTTVLLGTGWLKGFPAGAYVCLLPLLFFTDWLSGMWSFGKPTPVAGIKAWPALLAMLVIILWTTRSLQPLRQFIRGAWADWTRLSFLLIGMLPALQFILLDEAHGQFMMVHVVVTTVLLAAGAVAYLRSTTDSRKGLSLIGGMITGMLLPGLLFPTP